MAHVFCGSVRKGPPLISDRAEPFLSPSRAPGSLNQTDGTQPVFDFLF